MKNLINFIGDWLYGWYITLFGQDQDEDTNGLDNDSH